MRFKKLTVLTISFILVFSISTGILAADLDLTILHTNDTHGRLEEGKYDGMGFAKISTLVNDFRDKEDHVLLLDAGDVFHGQNIVNLVEGESAAEILNSIGYDAVTLGNHDFNFGQERIEELNDMTDFPLLAANLDPELVDGYVVEEIDGVEVGIFGLATPETAYKTHPKNVEGLTFRDPVEVSQEMVDKLSDEVDVIIALSHLGMSEGSDHTSTMVAEEVDGIDLIVDGHSHHVLEEGEMVNDTLIVQAGEYDKNLGIVNLEIEDNEVVNKEASLYTKEEAEDVEPDSDILDLIADIKDKNEEITSEVIGETAVELDGERENVRTGETNLGNLLTDAMLDAVDAEVAITNGGGIRASIDKGDVTRGEVISVLPFGNTVVVKEMKGSKLLDALEHGVSEYPATEGLFPQIGGMNLVFAFDRPAGERVLEVRVNGEPLDYDSTYRVATNDFMAAGGDGYDMFEDADTFQEAGGLEEVLMDYIGEQDRVAPSTEGRILPVEVKDDNYVYEVRKGDTLQEIAIMFDSTINQIMEVNEIEDADKIFEGQDIIVPAE